MKTEFVPLTSYPEDAIYRGAVLRFPAKFPYEKTVEFLVFENLDKTPRYGLMVISGYKAGLTANILPEDSCSKDGMGIDTQWLIANWTYWVYKDIPPEKVLIATQRYV